MKQVDENEEILTRYLLGELSEEEQVRVEERYFDDKEFFEQLLVIEDELIDAYVRRNLPPDRLRQFEAYFLRSPARVERVQIAEAWMKLSPHSPKRQPPAPKSLMFSPDRAFSRIKAVTILAPLAATVFLLGVSILMIQNGSIKGELREMQVQRMELQRKVQELEAQVNQQRLHAEEIARELEYERVMRSPPKPVEATLPREEEIAREIDEFERILPREIALVLNPGATRQSGQANRLILRQGIEKVRLQVYFRDSGHKSYQAVLRTIEGTEIWSRSKLMGRAKEGVKSLAFVVPADTVASGDYILTLSGENDKGEFETIYEYGLEVVKR